MQREILEQAGLSKGEADVYLILLKAGDSTATAIAKHTKIARPNIYDYLSKLAEKGLVSRIYRQGGAVYAASPPDRLMEFVDERRDILKEHLTMLQSLHNSRHASSKVEMYEGIVGLKIIMMDILQTGKEFVGWGGSAKLEEYLPKHAVRRYLEARKRRHITARLLYVRTEDVLKTPLTKFKAIPAEFSSPSTTLIYSEKVAIIIYAPIPVVLIIHSKELATSYRKHFELLWMKS